ncbi:unannotated protein [freshwater metagenome]|uniref:Unannotated protein n=1 Tax=freshwater metagenome TaxID=449393 RepID=A0A6J6JXD2_9ZZZZ
MGRSLNKSICVLHCQIDRDEPHTNARDLYSLALLSKFAEVTFINVLGPGLDEVDDRNFDLVIVSNSFMIMRSSPYWPTLLRRSSKVLLSASHRILFLQDDYHRIDQTVRFAKEMDIEIYSVFADVDSIYAEYGITAKPWLIGFADKKMDQLLSSLRIEWDMRTIDVGQRVFELSLEFGSEGRRKADLAAGFSKRMTELGLSCDVSIDERDRFSGFEWFEFLANCRATIGRHSGASLVSNSPLDQARALVIQDVFKNEEFERQLARYIGDRQREKSFLAPSPRVFEAASLQVLQVLEKSTVPYGIEEWNHFVPISSDLSDCESVAKFIKSSEAVGMAERCHMELFGNPKWRREKWIEDVAVSKGFTALDEPAEVKIPFVERDLYEKIASLKSRSNRLKVIRRHSKSARNGSWHQIEAVHRWTSIEVFDINEVIGSDSEAN